MCVTTNRDDVRQTGVVLLKMKGRQKMLKLNSWQEQGIKNPELKRTQDFTGKQNKTNRWKQISRYSSNMCFTEVCGIHVGFRIVSWFPARRVEVNQYSRHTTSAIHIPTQSSSIYRHILHISHDAIWRERTLLKLQIGTAPKHVTCIKYKKILHWYPLRQIWLLTSL